MWITPIAGELEARLGYMVNVSELLTSTVSRDERNAIAPVDLLSGINRETLQPKGTRPAIPFTSGNTLPSGLRCIGRT